MDLPSNQPLRWSGWLLAAAVLAAACLLSLIVGTKAIPLGEVWAALWGGDGSPDHLIVTEYRLPRTLLGLLAGLALGVAGCLMQGLTRNPLADPGLLGINAGAAFAITLAVAFLGVTQITAYVWFGFAGAALVSLVVYRLGTAGRQGSDPIRLTLAGVAVTAVLSGLTKGLILLNPKAFEEWRQWDSGSLTGRGYDVIAGAAPFIVVGLLAAVVAARSLNALALGDDLARSLGVHVGRSRLLTAVALTLLCGTATAAVGPITFVGLAVPHVARWIVGPDQRWIIAYSLLLAPILVLGSDVVGRIIIRPDEVPAGLVTAFLGAPVLIWLARRDRVSAA
ncbi:putative ABC transporter permease protein [Nocardia brasiliensis NBRC 14402]|uniref:FecCD family ABC transporter permease n=1 Tax=Nocardia brasiliensis TaxID=37326 RepID=UPI0002DAE3DE|nr:iron chelate uptake ABC transporter family permease subunit [Nocardia brasiliensis]ASF06946.1 Fe(3+)-siderophore ABC transporter permease [Nocardia brasiliensis]GAJ84343.1 putative ABC transporter permease protein [Nocardia brasiliensis NBRC 14402]SUB47828.1 Ferric enterobactin transport system permease protein fepD [Nocardia brasiliensis]